MAQKVDVYYRVLNSDAEPLAHDWTLLDESEKEQAQKFKNPLLRERYICTHGQLRTLLAGYANANPAALRIAKTEHGKPYLMDYPELAFNLSHTGNVMLLAVAKHCQVGIDVEHCKARASLADLVNKCFAEPEARYWQQLDETERLRAFYQCWTRKEAFVKATGFGISVGLKHCVINPNQPQQFLAVPTPCGLAEQWHNHDLVLDDNSLCAALVVNQPIECINWC